MEHFVTYPASLIHHNTTKWGEFAGWFRRLFELITGKTLTHVRACLKIERVPAAGELVPQPAIRSGDRLARTGAWLGRHHLLAIMMVAALAVVVSSYPIIFCGKSFVSPAGVGALVYEGRPSLPGMGRESLPYEHYADTGAALWLGVPVGFVQSRCVLDHWEIPLWNRYGHAGDYMLAQTASMFGDPLQLIVVFGHGSATAWDLKFLLAKWLFCFGLGSLVLRLLASLSLALVYSALAAWCGAYSYIGSHPAFFVLAYAPWILLSALEMLARPPVGSYGWGLVWLAANASCFCAGYVEMAVPQIGGLNFAALVWSLAAGRSRLNRAKIIACLGVGTLLFLGLTAPLWISFLSALPQADNTIHDKIKVDQMPPASFPGMFDDYLSRYQRDSRLIAPGSSLLVLAGCVFSLLRWRQLRHERFYWVNAGAILVWAGCVFGLVPARLIAEVPLLNRVGHVNVDFSYLLILHLTVQSAYGFKSLLKPETLQEAGFDFFAVSAVMALILTEYYWVSKSWPVDMEYFLACAAGAVGAPLLFKYLQARNGRVSLTGWAGIVCLGFIPNQRFGMYSFGDDAVFYCPGPRVVLNAPSPTLTQLKSEAEPFRVTGMGSILVGDYAAVYALEDIRSCFPMCNDKYVQLVRNFPGFRIVEDSWAILLENPDLAQPLLNLLNVKYVLAGPNARPPGGDHFTVRNFDDFTVLENKQAWPRAFFASQIVPVSSNEEFMRHLLQFGDRPFVAVDRAQADSDPDLRPLESETSPAIVPAEHYQLLPNSTAFDIHTPAAGVVCLTEGQADDFLAQANGRSVKVLTVNRAFKGIYLDQPGNYHVEFRYRPHLWTLSLTLFWFSAGMVLILGATQFIRPRTAIRLKQVE